MEGYKIRLPSTVANDVTVWMYPIGTHDVLNGYSTNLQSIGDQ